MSDLRTYWTARYTLPTLFDLPPQPAGYPRLLDGRCARIVSGAYPAHAPLLVWAGEEDAPRCACWYGMDAYRQVSMMVRQSEDLLIYWQN